MRVAYADPPYPGQSRKHYADHPDYAGEVNYPVLLELLMNDYPEGWVLHTSSTSLAYVLALSPEDVRIGAWVKPFASFKPGVNPAYAWEPVIFYGGRTNRPRSEETVRDWCAVPITLQRGLAGAKPEGVCFWAFSFLGLRPGDELVDLYPGTGAVTQAWERWQGQMFHYFPDGSPDLGTCPLCDGSGLWKSRMCQTCGVLCDGDAA